MISALRLAFARSGQFISGLPLVRFVSLQRLPAGAALNRGATVGSIPLRRWFAHAVFACARFEVRSFGEHDVHASDGSSIDRCGGGSFVESLSYARRTKPASAA
jgi:hypothetical protein